MKSSAALKNFTTFNIKINSFINTKNISLSQANIKKRHNIVGMYFTIKEIHNMS